MRTRGATNIHPRIPERCYVCARSTEDPNVKVQRFFLVHAVMGSDGRPMRRRQAGAIDLCEHCWRDNRKKQMRPPRPVIKLPRAQLAVAVA